MKVVQIVGYEKAIYTDAPLPVPGENDLLVKVGRAGVCHSDVAVFRQELGVYREGKARLPIIPGHEWAGEVVETGNQVTGFRVGDRITGECGIGCGNCSLCRQGLHNICPDREEVGVFYRNGAYAEYLTIPYTHAHHIYDLTEQQGSLIEPLTVGIWIVRRAAIQAGDRVGIIGTGTVGLMACMAAQACGAEQIVAFGRKPFKLQLARDLGADLAVNLTSGPLEDLVYEATGGEGFSVVIEATGDPNGATLSLRAAAPRARVVITGVFEGQEQAIDLNTIMPKELTVIGSLGGPTVFDEAIDLVRQGKMDVIPFNTHCLPLSMGSQALEMVAKGAEDLVKIHLVIA